LTQAQTAGQYFTNDQIKEMTRKVSAEVDLVHQQTQNQRYGSSHIGATAKDISNVVTDAASGVVDIFHGIDKAVADTWNNFWKDGKADGIGSNSLITISTTPVIAGDSFEMDAVGALRLSPLRRGLAIDSTVDIFTFYVPHRHVYGEQWIK